MSVAGIVVARPDGVESRRSRRPHVPADVRAARAASEAELDEVVVVLGEESRAGEFPFATTLLLDADGLGGSRAVRSAVDWCQREGHDAVVIAIGLAGDAFDPASWTALARSSRGPMAVLAAPHSPATLIRCAAESWPAIPLDGGLAQVATVRPELVVEVERFAAARRREAQVADGPTDEEVAAVTRLLGRPPQGPFTVVVRDRAGEPVVIENLPFLADGTPMPTRYWLVGRREQEAVGRLEAAGGVRRATEEIPAAVIAEAHARYAAGRDARIPAARQGPRPYGGVGGTREGIKCLHAHLAWYLAGGSDPVGRWTADAIAGQIDGPVGAVDCGTNSTRLLALGRDGEPLVREMTITRLGQGVDATGVLAPEAIERTLTALRRYRQILDSHGVVALRAVATSAARDAKNSAEFFDGAEEILGRRPELLSGDEEAGLSYAGATADFDPDAGPFLVCDLGGGSTELVVGGGDGEVEPTGVSLDLGCVRLSERYLRSDPPAPEELAAARAHVVEVVEGAQRDGRIGWPEGARPRVMIGLAGTVSSLVTLELGLGVYDHDRVHRAPISRAAVQRWTSDLAGMPLADRRRRPGLEPGRAEVIVAGALELDVVMGCLGYTELVHSEHDILDGLVAELRSGLAGVPRRSGSR